MQGWWAHTEIQHLRDMQYPCHGAHPRKLVQKYDNFLYWQNEIAQSLLTMGYFYSFCACLLC